MLLSLLTIGCFFVHSIVSFKTENNFDSEEPENSTQTVYNFNRHDILLKNKSAENLCFCSLGPDGCDYQDQVCLKHKNAACYHSVKLIYNDELNRMERVHYYGCAPYERVKNWPSSSSQDKGSLLTCNQGKSHHEEPFTIACCYEGNFCNIKLVPPPFNNFEEDLPFESDRINDRYFMFIFFAFIGVSFGVALIASFIWKAYVRKKKRLLERKSSISSMNSDSSGGASIDYAPLNPRTVAQYLTFLNEVARGRYGCVQKALFRTREVAVKTFYTNEEESWRNEKDIYETQMLNHENILQFVAADICSVDSITQMLLITDYHPLGSLYDYLRAHENLDLDEALQLALTSVCGLEHLHTKVQGTGNKSKPEIAHRDIKSKNIIVKRKNVCCIADFGLAVRMEKGQLIPAHLNPQSGTRRYMSPEVLRGSINIKNFEEFIKSDIYSLGLVFWEIFNRVDNDIMEIHNKHRRISSNSSNESGFIRSQSSQCITGESTPLVSTGINDETRIIRPFRLSYDEFAPNDPTIEQMRNLVCDLKLRPTFPEKWTENENSPYASIAELISEMWTDNLKSRHTALKIKMELDKIIEITQKLDPTRASSIHFPNFQSPPSSSGYGSGSRPAH
jgi:bone morphogenetic protein receptor type-1B|uniref:Serine/threonine-protein kinase receptor n=1 Tax=Panagrolaimus sp. PS1159 TaxID=55785 RepID=A0AC35FM01_9BILA